MEKMSREDWRLLMKDGARDGRRMLKVVVGGLVLEERTHVETGVTR